MGTKEFNNWDIVNPLKKIPPPFFHSFEVVSPVNVDQLNALQIFTKYA